MLRESQLIFMLLQLHQFLLGSNAKISISMQFCCVSGGIGLEALEVALAMSQAFQDYSENIQTVSSLKTINVVVYERSLLPVFEQHALPNNGGKWTAIEDLKPIR